MQRIDENTYIDDTLVTCAEYQLFIDEMREQGQYYQPDHWTSYQFPEGQARKPILGVRHSDAEAFCEWLTQRENREWRFRFPIQEEANAFPLKSLGESSLGYWLVGNHFMWVGSIPKDAQAFDLALDHVLDRVLDRALVLDRPFVLDHALTRAISLDRNLAFDLTLDTYKSIFTLQERVEGRSPAFEGIRLVKERIR